MKKEILIFLLFAGLITAAFFNIRYLETLTTDLKVSADSAEKSAETGDWAGAEHHAQNAISLWQEHIPYTYIVLHHGSIERTEDVLHTLLKEIRGKDADVVKAAAQETSATLDSLLNVERIWLGSIF